MLTGDRPPHPSRFGVLFLFGALLGSCDNSDDVASTPTVDPAADSVAAPAVPAPGEAVFDRELLFVSSGPDSLVAVPWLFRSRVTETSVARDQVVLLLDGGTWDLLASESTTAPSARSPWRILPSSTTGIVVGQDDRLESLLLRAMPGELELIVGNLMTEWPRPGSEWIRLYEGEALFPAGPLDGLVLDIDRRWEAAGQAGIPGDWIFLHAGSELQVFLEESVRTREVAAPAQYAGWTRLAFRNLSWDAVELEWSEVRAFEEARRDVPVRWNFATAEGDLVGTLEAVSSRIEAGAGEGPILPLSAFIEVRGELELHGESFEVVGIVRHVQS